MNKNKKSLVLMVGAATTLLLVISGAAYAYFTAQMGSGSGTSINATTATTDSLSFSVGKDIDIKADMENFLEGMESRHGETTATATLKANSNTNSATARYNVFFIIDKNDFEYSTLDGQTELLMKVTDPNNNEVENIQGLTRVENGGFDITTRTGGFLIAADYEIEATPTETTKSQTWKLEVTFVNLDAEQNKNKGKTLHGKLLITKSQESAYELAEINSMEATSTSNSITASLTSLSGTEAIDKYYYAIEEDPSGIAYTGAGVSVARLSNSLAIKDSDYIESDEPTHTFNNLKENTKYKVYSYATDKNGVNSNLYVANVVTSGYNLPAITGINHTSTPNSITVAVTAKAGTNVLSEYYFSKDNGVTWSEGQVSGSYTFNDLLEATEYKIKIKVKDSNGEYSTEYYKNITTSVYGNPNITTVDVAKTYNSISLTTTATGENTIEKYYYKVGAGSWSEGQTTNTYTVSNLKENTNYIIRVKVMDNEGKYSSEYALSVSTDSYTLPKIKNITIDRTLTSITINTTAEKGTGTITKYMYSKDNGSNWTTIESTSTSNSYTFDNLTTGAEYMIKIKVVDSNDKESNVYSSKETTQLHTFSGTVSNSTVTYDGNPHSLAINLTGPSTYQKYYSTSTELTKDNYTTGSTIAPTRTEPGQTPVYWCVVATGYETLCGNNAIIISKITPTLTLSENSKKAFNTLGYGCTSITYTYSGDGNISCADGTLSTCAIDTVEKKVTLTFRCEISGGSSGTENITITAGEGEYYLPAEQIVSVNWTCVSEDTLVDVWDEKKKKKLKKKIKDIKEGDIVYNYDYATDSIVTKRVKQVVINKTMEIYHIFVGGEELKITGSHPVCVEGLGYIDVSLLKVGYNMMGDGKYYPIEKIEIENCEEEQDMYCLELEDGGSSFMVGKNSIVCLAMFISCMIVMEPMSVLAACGCEWHPSGSAYYG